MGFLGQNLIRKQFLMTKLGQISVSQNVDKMIFGSVHSKCSVPLSDHEYNEYLCVEMTS